MQVIADRPEAPSAIRSDLGAIFVSLELVWGFFCQAGFCGGGIFFLSSVSLFDLKPVSPPRPSALLMSARAGAVKVGQLRARRHAYCGRDDDVEGSSLHMSACSAPTNLYAVGSFKPAP